jgi:hypothetical protein
LKIHRKPSKSQLADEPQLRDAAFGQKFGFGWFPPDTETKNANQKIGFLKARKGMNPGYHELGGPLKGS